MYKKILLPTDGSENAENAGKHALWLANVSGAEIVVLNVFELYYPKFEFLSITSKLCGKDKMLNHHRINSESTWPAKAPTNRWWQRQLLPA